MTTGNNKGSATVAAALLLAICVLYVATLCVEAGTTRTFGPRTEAPPTYLTPTSNVRRDGQMASVYNQNSSQIMMVFISEQTNVEPRRTSLYGMNLDNNGKALLDEPRPLFVFSQEDATSRRVKRNPSIDYHPYTDEYLVAFELDVSGDETSFDIYGIFLNGNGTVKSEPFAIQPSEGYTETNPKVAAQTVPRSTFPWLVVWEAAHDVGTKIHASCLITASSAQTLTVIGPDETFVLYPAVYYNLNTQDYLLLHTVQDPEDGRYDLYSTELYTNPDRGVTVNGPSQRIYGVLEFNEEGQTVHASSISPTIVGSSPLTVVWQVNGETQTYVAAARIDDQGQPIVENELIDVGTNKQFNKRPTATVDYHRNQLSVAFEAATEEDDDGNALDSNIYISVVDAGSLFRLMQTRVSTGDFTGTAHGPVISYTGNLALSWTAGDDYNFPSVAPSRAASRSPSPSPVAGANETVLPARESVSQAPRGIFAMTELDYNMRALEEPRNYDGQPPLSLATPPQLLVGKLARSRGAVVDSPPGALVSTGVAVVEYVNITSDDDDNDDTAVIVLVIICLFFGGAIIIIATIILIIVIKYRAILRSRLSEIREGGLPSLPRSDGFEQL